MNLKGLGLTFRLLKVDLLNKTPFSLSTMNFTPFIDLFRNGGWNWLREQVVILKFNSNMSR